MLNLMKSRPKYIELERLEGSRVGTWYTEEGFRSAINYMMPEKGRMPARKDVARLLNDLNVSTRRLEAELEWDGANR